MSESPLMPPDDDSESTGIKPDEQPHLLPQTEQSQSSTRGLVIGFGIGFTLIIITIGILIWNSKTSETRVPVRNAVMDAAGTVDPYAAFLKITDVHMLEAQNLLGGKSTYVEGHVTNTGKSVVSGATVEITFRNSLNEVCQREQRALTVVLRREPAIDTGALNLSPLKTGETKEFQIVFEHVSRDWNGQYPEVRVVTAVVK